jgi:peptide/nickel transport system permease protein
VIAVGLFAPWVAPHNPADQDLNAVLQPPRWKHLLGTDELGRDVLSRIVYGARTSLTLGLVVVAIATVTGTLLGLGAGYFGGVVDGALMALTDIAMAFPGFLLALLVVSIIGTGLFQTMVAIGVAYVPRFIRISRASTLAARELEYVQAAYAIGRGSLGIMGKHILPNLMGPITVQATLLTGSAILIAASLSFLGLGAQPPLAEWGNMISDARQYLRNAPHASTFPGLAILLVVLAINLVGDGLRDALDVRTE